MKAFQVRELPVVDLKISLKDNYEALQNLKFQQATGQLENYKAMTNTKKDIARMKTILREKELKINEKLNKSKK